ncbi:hypothetical protein J5N97_022932 [Dioscorea zingiberensis]|uniref:Leucine-rich repeat-containing N-terminal plant-type domain-containing protein n=1 Tax=Dioscorea zingiberensis TaxID=325984 RepID=A0A9D5CC77_9LILI|nr:hypothetical protein J5N97_022932 [Dioscorea zingiberensis]
MGLKLTQLIRLLLLIITLQYHLRLCLCNNSNSSFGCREDERKALLEFKEGLKDPAGRLSSWVGQDCCIWRGVECHNKTGQLISLDLGNTEPDIDDFYNPLNTWPLQGEIHPSLFGLKHLRYLDLSRNDFEGTPIPTHLGSLKSLAHLDLSYAGFSGPVPHQLGNLSNLLYLDLSSNNENSSYLAESHWLANLSSLRILHLNNVNLSRTPDLLESLNKVPSISELSLSGCSLHVPPSLGYVNLTNLLVLDLSDGTVTVGSTIPPWLFQLSRLKYLSLSGNNFQGLIPGSFQNLTSLEVLDLSNNSFYGQFPKFQISGLQWLLLSKNYLNGSIPKNLGQSFPGIIKLYLAENHFSDVLTQIHFANLTKIEYLDISSNTLELNVSSNWVPPLSLRIIVFANCQMGPRFPAWLQKLENVYVLDLSNTSISDALLHWFWNFSLNISYVDLSNNEIKGKLPPSLEHLKYLDIIDLSVNCFEGKLPQFFPSTLSLLELSNNLFSGSFPMNIGETIPNLRILSLSLNNLTGSLPKSLCHFNRLLVLSLSYNHFTGEIPDCWGQSILPPLFSMDLSYNELSGSIPTSVCSLPLKSLYLVNNNFSGQLPLSLGNCSQLLILNLGQNKFSGFIPTWLPERLPLLKALILRSNMLIGDIPPQLGCHSALRIIDFADNHLSGAIPHSLGNLNAMKVAPLFLKNIKIVDELFVFNLGAIEVNMKGRHDLYGDLPLLVFIDLSINELSGEIPEELARLSYLQGLNLSGNNLIGRIPDKISNLVWLESLDLSKNDLSGVIPQVLVNLSFLNHLNLSYNKLSGRIPFGGQLQALPDPSIYVGNDALCGFPLEIKCETDDESKREFPSEIENGSEMETIWFYLSIVFGFIFGFWSVCGALLLNKKWRFAYFQLVDHTYNKIYVYVAIHIARMKRSHFGSC